MATLSDIVMSQTQMGPHPVSLLEVGLLVAGIFVLILVFPYLQSLPLIWRRKTQ